MFPIVNTSMLRERFVIRDKLESENASQKKPKEPVIALGNRIALPLTALNNEKTDHIIVRGHNMHCVARVASRVFRDFGQKGAILDIIPTYDWEGVWKTALSSYEEQYNTSNWIAVYNRGKKIFSKGKNHPFLDIIEQCDATNRDEYDRATKIAEDAFKQAGKAVKIEKQTTIALIIGINEEKARCGVIFRNPRRATTFNFMMEPKRNGLTDGVHAEPHSTLNMCASYLEGIQLGFTVGRLKHQLRTKGLGSASQTGIMAQAAQQRIGRLNAEIKHYENLFDVKYRPERPSFFDVIKDTEAVLDGE